MKLVETIQLKKTRELSRLCHLCKSLYNLGNYYINQYYDILEEYLNWYNTKWILKKSVPFKLIPSQVAQNVLKNLHLAWKSYFNSLKDWKKNPQKYEKRPHPPKYLKKDGEYIACFNHQHIKIKNGKLYFPKKTKLEPITVITKQEVLQQVRIIPKNDIYNLELVYNYIEKTDFNFSKDRMIAIDIGVNILACMVNNIGLKPLGFISPLLKSTNQYYNKQLAYYQSKLKKENGKFDSKRLQKLRRIRDNKVKDYMHKTSRYIINYCIENNIGTIIIGKNDGWKQNVNLGKKNNQKFVQIPFNILIEKLQYKANLVGINIEIITEEYTSQTCYKCGTVKKSNRKYRGLYICSSCKTTIHADVNGAYNIMEKAFPKSLLTCGMEGAQLHPLLINLDTKSRSMSIKSS